MPTMSSALEDFAYGDDNEEVGLHRAIVPFVACGDLTGLGAPTCCVLFSSSFWGLGGAARLTPRPGLCHFADSDQSYPLDLRTTEGMGVSDAKLKFAAGAGAAGAAAAAAASTARVYIPPVQAPINPPYAEYLSKRRATAGGAPAAAAAAAAAPAAAAAAAPASTES